MAANRTILLVEDNQDDVFLMTRALHSARIVNPLIRVESAQEAMDYLAGAGKFSDRDSYPLPAVVFLDLKLPLVFGHEVIAWIRSQPGIRIPGDHCPHVVLRSERFKPVLRARGKLVFNQAAYVRTTREPRQSLQMAVGGIRALAG